MTSAWSLRLAVHGEFCLLCMKMSFTVNRIAKTYISNLPECNDYCMHDFQEYVALPVALFSCNKIIADKVKSDILSCRKPSTHWL